MQGTDRMLWRGHPHPLCTEQPDLSAAALPGVNNPPLSYQLRSRCCPADKAPQSAALPLSQFFPPFTLLAFCLPHLLTLQLFQGKNCHVQYSQNGPNSNEGPLAPLKYKQHRFNTDYSMDSSTRLKQYPTENTKSSWHWSAHPPAIYSNRQAKALGQVFQTRFHNELNPAYYWIPGTLHCWLSYWETTSRPCWRTFSTPS